MNFLNELRFTIGKTYKSIGISKLTLLKNRFVFCIKKLKSAIQSRKNKIVSKLLRIQVTINLL